MRPSLLLAASLLALAPASTALAQSSVWKVTRGKSTIYLGGTVHVLREEDFPLPAEFDIGFQESDELWFEVSMAEMTSPAVAGRLLRESVLPGGETLESRLTPEAWQALADYCQASGLSLATMGRFKPGVLVMNISIFEYTKLGMHQQGVELFYEKLAVQYDKPTRGLETAAEQFGFIESLGAGDPSALILQTIHDIPKMEQLMETMISAWRRGDLRTLDATIMKELATSTPEVTAVLVDQRNRNWIPRIMPMFQTESVEFVLVGAGHLPGKNGLIALLKKQGCKVRQVKAPKAK
jgi:uncharacterized protein YbaP (TraB family)